MTVRLNQRLVIQKGLNDEEVALILELHKQRQAVVNRMKRSKRPSTLKNLAAEVTALDYRLQAAWKFELDAKFHRFWELPGCLCAKLDNIDDYPYRQHFRQDCPIHGW